MYTELCLRAGSDSEWQHFTFNYFNPESLHQARKKWADLKIDQNTFQKMHPSRSEAQRILESEGISPRNGFDALVLTTVVICDPSNLIVEES